MPKKTKETVKTVGKWTAITVLVSAELFAALKNIRWG